jgi:hypothetical protein
MHVEELEPFPCSKTMSQQQTYAQGRCHATGSRLMRRVVVMQQRADLRAGALSCNREPTYAQGRCHATESKLMHRVVVMQQR